MIGEGINLQVKAASRTALEHLQCDFVQRTTFLAPLASTAKQLNTSLHTSTPASVLLYPGQGPATHAIVLHAGQLYFHALAAPVAPLTTGLPSLEQCAGGRVGDYRVEALQALMRDNLFDAGQGRVGSDTNALRRPSLQVSLDLRTG